MILISFRKLQAQNNMLPVSGIPNLVQRRWVAESSWRHQFWPTQLLQYFGSVGNTWRWVVCSDPLHLKLLSVWVSCLIITCLLFIHFSLQIWWGNTGSVLLIITIISALLWTWFRTNWWSISTVLCVLEQLQIMQMIKKLTWCDGTWIFVINKDQLLVPVLRLFSLLHNIFILTFLIILSSCLYLHLPGGLFPRDFCNQNVMCIFYISHLCYLPCLYNPALFCHHKCQLKSTYYGSSH